MKNTKKHSKQLAGLWLALLASAFQVATPNYFWNHPAHMRSDIETAFPISTELADANTRARVSAVYGKLPMSFEANDGQIDSQVKFLSRGAGYNLFLTRNEAVLELQKENETSALRMKLVGANPEPRIEGLDELSGKSNYIIGNDPAKWRKNVSQYAKVRYEDIYPGIDLVYYGNQRDLEYDFVLAPGSDPRSIKLSFEGAQDMRIDAQGDLVLSAEAGDVRHRKPVIYQEIEDIRKEIAGRFLLEGEGGVRFEVSSYDESKPLVIDPVLKYPTYLGSKNVDLFSRLIVDNLGNTYVVGSTSADDFPTTEGAFQPKYGGNINDLFVTKLDATGTAIYSTFLGGNGVEANFIDIPLVNRVDIDFIVDAVGNVYLAGETSSPDFPTTEGAFQPKYGGSNDVFVTKLDTDGTPVYSTYLGGRSSESFSTSIVDSTGNIFVVGTTGSDNFKTTEAAFQDKYGGGFSDLFVTKLDVTGSAVYSTYLGGSRSEFGSGRIDASGNAYLFGTTGSDDFKTTEAAFQDKHGGGDDAFVTKLNVTGSAVYSTYLGGSRNEFSSDIKIDSSCNAYLIGSTNSDNFPTMVDYQLAHLGFSDEFVTKLDTDGTPIYSTSFGGSEFEETRRSALDAAGNIYLVGDTTSIDFPTVAAFQPKHGGGTNTIFVTKLDAYGTPVYSTYLGGSNFQSIIYSTVDATGSIYVVGVVFSDDFPTVAAFQPKYGGGFNDLYATKLDATGRAVYSTFIGGEDDVFLSASMVDESGNLYLAGDTNSLNFPTKNAFQAKRRGGNDGYLTKLDAQGQAVYSTYLGGSNDEFFFFDCFTLDSSGNVYISGTTTSGNFPTLFPLQPISTDTLFEDTFITKLSATGSLLYSSYLGGRGSDQPRSVAVAPSGSIYVTGLTGSPDFPVSPDAFQKSKRKGNNFDLYVAKFEPPELIGGFRIINVSLIRKTLYVVGEGFDIGSVILLNSTHQETNHKTQDSTVLISNAAGQKIKQGKTVTIRVRNSDGRITEGFRFTLPRN